MLPTDGIVRPLLHQFYTINVRSSTICLRGTDHVDPPHITADHCHDVANVGAIHHDAVPVVFERVEYHQQKVDPLLDRDGVVVCLPQIPVRLFAEHSNVHFVQRQVAVRDRQ
jgi:hypothetical protein